MPMSTITCRGENHERLVNKETVTLLSQVPASRCWHCSFPRKLKRGSFLSNRYLCPCDVDISISEEPSRLRVTTDPRHHNSLADASSIGDCCKHQTKVSVLTSPMKTIGYNAVKLESQRRIDELNSALSATTSLSSYPVCGGENMNNSACSNLSNVDKTASDSSRPTLSTSQSLERDRQFYCARSSCLGNAHRSFRMGYQIRPRRRNGCALHHQRSSVRYHPYLIPRHRIQKYRNCRSRHKQIAALSQHRWLLCNKDESLPSRLGKIYQRKLSSGRIYNCDTSWCSKNGRGFLKQVCPDKAVSRWCWLPHQKNRDNVHQHEAITGANRSGRIVCDSCPRVLNFGRLPAQEVRDFAPHRTMEAETHLQLSGLVALQPERVENSNKAARLLENINHGVSHVCGGVEETSVDSSYGEVESCKESNKPQSCGKLVNIKLLSSETSVVCNVTLDGNIAQTQFTFSKPLVAFSKSEQETVSPLLKTPTSIARNVPCPSTPRCNGLPTRRSEIRVNIADQKRYQHQSDDNNITRRNDRDSTSNNSNNNDTARPINNNDTARPINNNSNNNDTARPINNNDTARPINNNSTSQRSSAPLDGRVVRVEGDGRCLFRSLVTADYLPLQLSWRDEFGRPVDRELAELETTRADDLRSRVVTIMSDNMHFYSQLEQGIINADQPMDGNYQRFLDRLRAMSEPSTMPGDLELNAVAMVMERQILVLDTNLAVITSYGHDRFPQSVPLAVRYTRLVADVGHYDAVILCDDHLARITGHRGQHHGAPAYENSGHLGLCGQFRRLTTCGGGQNKTPQSSEAKVYPRGGYGGDATLNAKKEFFYLRDSDKSLHSDGLQPVTSITSKISAKVIKDQRTAEAATSTVRATVCWSSQHKEKSHPRKRRKRRTFSDKITQTDDAIDKPHRAEWKNRYYQYRYYGLCKPGWSASERKLRTKFAYADRSKKAPKKSVIRGQNMNWNSRVKKLTGSIRLVPKIRCLKSEEQNAVTLGRFKSVRTEKDKNCTDNNLQSPKEDFYPITSSHRFARGGLGPKPVRNDNALKSVCSKNAPHLGELDFFEASTKSNSNCGRNIPTKYINICSPNKPPKPVKPEVTKPRAATPCRRRKSVLERNRSRKRRAQTLSPVSTRSPPVLSKKPRLPDAFEPGQCRCVLCNTKIEPSARESAKCFMCGRMAHRACVMKESSRGGQGGGDQNYFICSFCVTL